MKVLAYTVVHHDTADLKPFVSRMRAAAGHWYDWFVYLSAPSERVKADAKGLLHEKDRTGIQALCSVLENRGQHWGTKEALEYARENKYDWLLRLDPDIQPRTKKFLKKMLERLTTLKEMKGDEFYRFVAAPRIVGLRNPIEPLGTINVGQDFPAEVMPVLGGACRLHPVDLLEQYEPPIYAPVGRGDPESLAEYLEHALAFMVRFPDIRVIHRTNEIEGKDTEEQALTRKMSKYWPWLGEAAC